MAGNIISAYNNFVRRLIDDLLDRSLTFCEQPKNLILAIEDICQQAWPQVDSRRHRYRIRAYLKACRRNRKKNNGEIRMKEVSLTSFTNRERYTLYNAFKRAEGRIEQLHRIAGRDKRNPLEKFVEQCEDFMIEYKSLPTSIQQMTNGKFDEVAHVQVQGIDNDDDDDDDEDEDEDPEDLLIPKPQMASIVSNVSQLFAPSQHQHNQFTNRQNHTLQESFEVLAHLFANPHNTNSHSNNNNNDDNNGNSNHLHNNLYNQMTTTGQSSHHILPSYRTPMTSPTSQSTFSQNNNETNNESMQNPLVLTNNRNIYQLHRTDPQLGNMYNQRLLLLLLQLIAQKA